jgi:hypothetical protein
MRPKIKMNEEMMRSLDWNQPVVILAKQTGIQYHRLNQWRKAAGIPVGKTEKQIDIRADETVHQNAKRLNQSCDYVAQVAKKRGITLAKELPWGHDLDFSKSDTQLARENARWRSDIFNARRHFAPKTIKVKKKGGAA